MAKLLVLHGPNLNLLGTREPEVYGHATLADIDRSLAAQAQAVGHQLDSFQSNAEHALVDRIQARGYSRLSAVSTVLPHEENRWRRNQATGPLAPGGGARSGR